VEFGGTIRPKRAKMLHWKSKTGKDVFAHEVHQPAHPYLRPAFDEEKAAAVEEIAGALRSLLEGV